MINEITKTEDCSTPRQLDYIPKVLPDEFLGWYEYRVKKFNFVDYSNNTFVYGKWAYTLPFKIESNNIFSKLDVSYLNTLLMQHTTIDSCIDEGSLYFVLNLFRKLSSRLPSKIIKPLGYVTNTSINRSVEFTTSNFLYKSRIRFCPSCLVDQVKSHGVPWLKLSWFKNIESCEIHEERLIEPYCQNCNELLVRQNMFDSILLGKCTKCRTVLWGTKDYKPLSRSTGQHFIGERRPKFFVHESVNLMLRQFFLNLNNEVISLTENFTKQVELSNIERFALHSKNYDYSYVKNFLFAGNWREFIKFFGLKTIWKSFKINSGASLSIKVLVAEAD